MRSMRPGRDVSLCSRGFAMWLWGSVEATQMDPNKTESLLVRRRPGGSREQNTFSNDSVKETQQQAKIIVLFPANVGERKSHLLSFFSKVTFHKSRNKKLREQCRAQREVSWRSLECLRCCYCI